MSASRTDNKVPASQVVPGMFVCELDRPWTETPFPIQGFLIESDEDVLALMKHCQFVYIDRNKSVGAQFRPDASTKKLLERDPVIFIMSSDGRGEPTMVRSAPKLSPRQPLRKSPRLHASIVGRKAGPGATGAQEIHMGDGTVAVLQHLTDEERAALGDAGTAEAEDGTVPEVPRTGWLKGLVGRTNTVPVRTVGKTQPVQIPPAADYPHSMSEEMPRARSAMERVRGMVRTVVQQVWHGHPLPIGESIDVVRELLDSMQRNPNAILWLLRLRIAEADVFAHSLQAGIYLALLAAQLGLHREEREQVCLGGFLLDVGKLRIPPSILHKRERLTPDEFAVVKDHVQYGLNVLAESDDVTEILWTMLANHHEREDGSGYPAGLKGEKIGLYGRMAGLVDTFVAMSNERPYSERTVTMHDALRLIWRGRGKLFQEALLEQFVQAIGVYPVGSLVELSSGEVAVVVAHHRSRRTQPRVHVLTSPDKTPLEKPLRLDLTRAPRDPSGRRLRIVRVLETGAHGVDPLQRTPTTEQA